MQKIIALLFLTCLVATTNAQKLTLQLSEKSLQPTIFKNIRVEAIILNDSSSPIRLFRNAFKEYGGAVLDWTVDNDGEQKKLWQMSLDTNSKFSKGNFVVLLPGEKYRISSKQVSIPDDGNYKISFRFQQDPATVNMRYGGSGEAKASAAKITKMDLSDTFEFTIDPVAIKELVLQDITYEELQKKKVFHNLNEAAANPSEVFKVNLNMYDDSKNYDKEWEIIGTLKNLRSLKVYAGKNPLKIPAEVGELLLMEIDITSNGGAVEFPENFLPGDVLKKLYLRNLNYMPEFVERQKGLLDISFTANGLTAIPDWIGNMTELTSLNFAENEITALPTSLEKLTKIKNIQMRSNKIVKMEHIFNNTGLTHLNMEYNKLETIPDGIGNFTELKELRLDRNEIRNISPEIGKLKKVTDLKLNYNKLTTLPAELYDMSSLDDLFLENNQLTGFPDGISKLTKMSSIRFRDNQVRAFPKGISSIAQLNYLDARKNPIKKGSEYKKLKSRFRKGRLKVD